MKNMVLLFSVLLFLSGCIGNQLAGRHYIRHPETGEKLWATYDITAENWDAEEQVWRNGDGSVCNDYYLYPDKQEQEGL